MPLASPASKVARGLGFVGTAALGAAVYGQWLAPEPMSGASALLGGGSGAAKGAAIGGAAGTGAVRTRQFGGWKSTVGLA